MNIYDKKIELICSLPPLYSLIKETPAYPFYYIVKLHSWDIKKNDYVETERLAYFSGKNFYDTDIVNADRTNWITGWRNCTAEELF